MIFIVMDRPYGISRKGWTGTLKKWPYSKFKEVNVLLLWQISLFVPAVIYEYNLPTQCSVHWIATLPVLRV